MKKIAFVNQKGGVGKTTTVVNLGSVLAEMGKKILLVDADPQGNCTSGVGIDKNAVELSTYDVLLNDSINPHDAIVKTEIENLSIIPANIDLAGSEVELVNSLNREKKLKRKLEGMEEFDYILIDAQPSLGLITMNVLTAADSILIPVQCEYYALEGLGMLMQTLALVRKELNPSIELEGVLITMNDSRVNLSAQVAREIRTFFEEKTYRTTIPRNIRVSEAPSFGKPINYYDNDCSGAIAYQELAEEFLKIQNKSEKVS